ncbi:MULTISPECIES: PQQ-binding-like beta-propeller repeat protein [Kitasatospora]|uniref:outer membrane protein assembly factor BamB family protein n=1 Tax=Kitasatospora TaxID=2063 RepID=UPI000CB751DA|nr:PQQ-binding-like beta-propeller repeat protein [Kitasatospora sp. GP30]MDH6138355.1 hypothetical protein [Kitasatospora sp. GP30]
MIADAVPVRTRRDPVSGLWTLTAPAWSLRSPVVTGDAVLLLVDGQPTALDAATGQVRWRAVDRIPLGERVRPVLRPAGSRLVIAGDEPDRYQGGPVSLTALDLTDGSRAWVRDAELLSGFLVDGPTNTVLLWQSRDSAPQHLTALNLDDGSVRWRHEFSKLGAPVLVGERVIVSVPVVDEGGLFAFQVHTGVELWRDGANTFHRELRCTGREVLARIAYDEWVVFAPGTGERLHTRQHRLGWSTVNAHGDGTALWFKQRHRLLKRAPALGTARPARFLLRRPFSNGATSDTGLIELDGRVYAVVQSRHDFAKWRRLLGFSGQRVHTARADRAFALLRPLRGRPVKRGAFVDMLAGPDRLYLAVVYHKHDELLAYRDGRVLWSKTFPYRDVVPSGEHLLVLTRVDDQDQLLLIDGENGDTCRA